MPRDNQVILLAGTRGTGKTDFLKQVIKASNMPKKLVVDTFDSAVWQNLKTWNHPEWENIQLPIVKTSQLPQWNSGTYRIFSSDTSTMMSAIQDHCANTLLVFEDATKYVRANLQDDVRKFVLDSKQKNLDIIFVFHSLASIPRELARISDLLVLFKTNEALTSTLKNKFPVSTLEPAFNKVHNATERHINKTIRLN